MESMETEEPLPPGYPKVSSGTYSDESPYVCPEHPNNEDRVLRCDDMVSTLKLAPGGTRGPIASLYVVVDGHGGDGASKFVSNHLHHLIGHSAFYENIDYPADEALASAVEEGLAAVEELKKSIRATTPNQAYADWARRAGDTSGCCADCEAILINEKGVPVSLSRPHRATDHDEKARIIHAGGSVMQGRVMGVLEPSRVIGDLDIKRRWPGCVTSKPYVTVRSLPYKRGQGPSYLVVASDGVWDSMTQTRVSALVSEAFRRQKTPSQVSHELVTAAREAGSGDDITAVVAKLG